MRVAPVIELSDRERNVLGRLSRGRSSSVRVRERAAMVLLASEGMKNQEIAAVLKQDAGKVGRWRKRYGQGGLEAILKDKTRPGRIRPLLRTNAPR